MITGHELLDLLPQAQPMIMIDALLSSDSNTTTTNLTIKKDNVFSFEGKFKEAGLIENMAQTAAVRFGYMAKKANTPIKVGYIASIKNLEIYLLPQINETLTTTIIEKTVIDKIIVISASIKSQNKLIAKCEMTVVIIDNN